jgi:gamma-glutamylcyclotransferase (GGCT)/AIG2-like uncharacterized protein YtfP
MIDIIRQGVDVFELLDPMRYDERAPFASTMTSSENTAMKTRLFVYGTLKSDQSNHHRMAGQTFIAVAHTTPEYRLFEVEGRFDSLGKYPALVKLPHAEVASEGVCVQGELWDVDDDCLTMLNQYEDLDSGEYVIEPIAIKNPVDDVIVLGYIYNWSIVGMRDSGHTWSL